VCVCVCVCFDPEIFFTGIGVTRDHEGRKGRLGVIGVPVCEKRRLSLRIMGVCVLRMQYTKTRNKGGVERVGHPVLGDHEGRKGRLGVVRIPV
jgi:hypothetical protein